MKKYGSVDGVIILFILVILYLFFGIPISLKYYPVHKVVPMDRIIRKNLTCAGLNYNFISSSTHSPHPEALALGFCFGVLIPQV
jgi:hypothetical protein